MANELRLLELSETGLHMDWILLTLLYGVIKGVRDVVKKESLKKSTVVEVLFFYTLFAFLLCIPASRDIGNIDPRFLPLIFVKAFVIFIAWILSFKAIKDLPLSVYGILDLSRVLFATLLGLLVLHEQSTINQIIGLILVSGGLLLLRFGNISKKKEKENVKPVMVVLALLSCALNAVSGFLDKVLTKDVTASQLQFYYMLFLTLLYLFYMLFSKTKVSVKGSIKNYWIWILAILFVIADKSLFMANAIPESRITIMTLVKQAGCVVSLAAGKFLYKEKNMLHKCVCTAIIVAGIVVAVM